jgi:hypothetical protein
MERVLAWCRNYSLEVLTALIATAFVFLLLVVLIAISLSFEKDDLPTGLLPAISILPSALIFIGGTIYGRLRDRREARRSRALSLFTEWHSPDMRESRIFVSHYREKMNRDPENLPALSDVETNAALERRQFTVEQMSEKPELESWSRVEFHFFRIYQFFERWSLLLRYGDIARVDSNNYMSSYARWYLDEFIIPWFKKEDEKITAKTGGDKFIFHSLSLIVGELCGRRILLQIKLPDNQD